jgi:curved DNA-binding protein CbpA
LSERLCWIKLKKMMKVSAAYEILQLEQSASAEEINASYRRLLMEYHPDRNVDRADWSHQMTIRLTEAYEAVLTYIESLEASEALRKAAEEEQRRGSEAEEEADSGYSLGTQAQIAGLYDQILDQIHSYYNEGMDKIYLRQEGSMRQRYRAVLRRLTHIIERLAMAAEMPGSNIQHKQINGLRLPVRVQPLRQRHLRDRLQEGQMHLPSGGALQGDLRQGRLPRRRRLHQSYGLQDRMCAEQPRRMPW